LINHSFKIALFALLVFMCALDLSGLIEYFFLNSFFVVNFF
jgi:hypothetical protein